MVDKLANKKAKLHLDRAFQLEREWQSRKSAGERRIQKMEEELKQDLLRIRTQIDGHREKAMAAIQPAQQSHSAPAECQKSE